MRDEHLFTMLSSIVPISKQLTSASQMKVFRVPFVGYSAMFINNSWYPQIKAWGKRRFFLLPRLCQGLRISITRGFSPITIMKR